MTDPTGHGEELRIPARAPERSRRRFGATWWGRAWLAALEEQASLDPNRLPRGRSYARKGAVGETVIRPGRVTAAVQGSRPTPYRVRLSVPEFPATGWTRVLDSVAARLGHLAALLDGELPPEVVEDVRDAGLSLLPGARELTVSCTCPDSAVPCKHAAAVCCLVADVLDTDPFALLLLRGRGRDRVLAELRSRRRATSAGADRPTRDGARPDPGTPVPGSHPAGPATVPAEQEFDRQRPALPRPLPPPPEPGTVGPFPASTAPEVTALLRHADRAVRRAHRLLTDPAPDDPPD